MLRRKRKNEHQDDWFRSPSDDLVVRGLRGALRNVRKWVVSSPSGFRRRQQKQPIENLMLVCSKFRVASSQLILTQDYPRPLSPDTCHRVMTCVSIDVRAVSAWLRGWTNQIETRRAQQTAPSMKRADAPAQPNATQLSAMSAPRIAPGHRSWQASLVCGWRHASPWSACTCARAHRAIFWLTLQFAGCWLVRQPSCSTRQKQTFG